MIEVDECGAAAAGTATTTPDITRQATTPATVDENLRARTPRLLAVTQPPPEVSARFPRNRLEVTPITLRQSHLLCHSAEQRNRLSCKQFSGKGRPKYRRSASRSRGG